MSYIVQSDNSTYTNRCNGRRKGEDNRTTDTVIARQSYLDVCINIPPVVKTTKIKEKTKWKYHRKINKNQINIQNDQRSTPQRKNKGEIPQYDHKQINTTQINIQNDQRIKNPINKTE